MSYATKPTILTTTQVFTGTFRKVALGNTHNSRKHQIEKRKPGGAVLHWLLNQRWTSMVSPLTLRKLFKIIYILCLQNNLVSLIHCTSETFLWIR